MSNTIPGISRFPCGVLLAQHRIETVLLEEISKHPNVTIQRRVEPIDIEIDNSQIERSQSHPVTVKLKQTARDVADLVVNGADEGPARKQKCSDGRFDRSRITPDSILEAAQRIIRPYKLEYKHRDCWTVYQIGQRVGNHFSAEERIFLAGDAIHTHSPKAGQGMNVSMQDTYNLGWKLAMVVKGIAKPSILKTYETERRAVAEELIAFDQEYSRLWSSRPKKDAEDANGLCMAAFERAFIQQQLFASGFGVHYHPNPLIAYDSSGTNGIINHLDAVKGVSLSEDDYTSSHQHLASKTILGQRFPSFKVINHSDARCWHLANWLKSDGHFHILLFAGDVSQCRQMDRVRKFAREMTKRSNTIPLQRRRFAQRHSNSRSNQSTQGRGGVARLLTIHAAPRQRVEMHDFPSLLLPYDEELGYDYDRVFVDGESYYEGHGRAYEGYGIDPSTGCVMVLRPDQHVAWIGEVEDVAGLEGYFARILVGGGP
ncbi:MAG: hypothetical protein LQ346_007292 [Caloplaca aetnensis]|nr:MAG: hypothetical protein LQ346_007292 [Caloplaca aetnensis]